MPTCIVGVYTVTLSTELGVSIRVWLHAKFHISITSYWVKFVFMPLYSSCAIKTI